MSFSFETTTDEVLEGFDLAGKNALVTGASGGLGAETGRALASKGARVILAARNMEKLAQVQQQIIESTGNNKVETLELHLDDLDQVRAAVAELNTRLSSLNILINNAGIMATPFGKTAQGFEMQFGVNHMGHFVFTNGLIELLKAGAPARVVMLSSGGHKYGCVNLDDPNWEKSEYNKWQAYGAAKSANALFAVALNKRFSGDGIYANAVHPGVIFTDLGRHLTAEDIEALSGGKAKSQQDAEASEDTELEGQRGKLVLKTVEQGAATSVWAATAPELEQQGGLYLEDCSIGSEVAEGVQENGYYAYLLDEDIADGLWKLSENLLK